MPKIIAITGPSGAGKTTVSVEFTKRNKTYANIDVDHLKHMNPNAFTKIINEDDCEDFRYYAWALLGKNTALLAQSFIDAGLDVIINGYLEVEAWEAIEQAIKIDYKFLLLPNESTNIDRDSNRTNEVKMGEKAVISGQKYFRTTDYYSSFKVIDTTADSVNDTVTKLNKVHNQDDMVATEGRKISSE